MDETCTKADAGILKIVGQHGRHKHDKEGADSRLSTTTLCTGSAAGENGPILCLSKGATVPAPYNDERYLEEDLGMPKGTQVVPTPSGFMTDLAFDTAIDKYATGIRAMKKIADHPTWWVRSKYIHFVLITFQHTEQCWANTNVQFWCGFYCAR
jgi:hypothetical protein